MEQVMELSNDWMACSAAPTVATLLTGVENSTYAIGNTTAAMYGPFWTNDYWHPYGYCYPSFPTVEHKPIKLSLAEVETLKRAAKQDAKLRDVLAKFTGQIEVVVEFK